MSSTVTPYFAVEIRSASFIPHRWLFEDFLSDVLNNSGFEGSNIYYLCRVKKLRLQPETAQLDASGMLAIDVKIRAHRTVGMQKVDLCGLPPFSRICPDGMEGLSPSFDFSASSAVKVVLNLTVEDKVYPFPIPLENIIAVYDPDFENPPEIL